MTSLYPLPVEDDTVDRDAALYVIAQALCNLATPKP